MNALLIHNDNLPTKLIDGFINSLPFSIPQSKILEEGFSFDKEVHQQVGKKLAENTFEVIFLPYSLSENYLELTGLRLALHIRLTPEWGHKKIPIVFIGYETAEQIAKLSDLGHLLFTTGVFTTQKFNIEYIKEQYKWITNNWRKNAKASLTDNEYQTFLSKIKILPPANYDSHHSIDNELALLRWSEYIGCDSDIPEVKNNIRTDLYFKYQKTLNPLPKIKNIRQFLLQGKANVLLIDDEAKKGWKIFYKSLLKNSSTINLKSLDIDYSSSTQKEIISKAKESIQQNDPDVILLDLRLHDKDFESNMKPEGFTGYKILQTVKEFNKGIQVIITTASNKVWNYEPLIGIGSNGYIIKNGDLDVTESIQNLKGTIEKGIRRVVYLKKAFSLVNELQTNLEKTIKEKKLDKGFGKELINLLSISFNMLETANNRESFAYAYLSLFKCLELINNKYTFKNDIGNWNIIGPKKLKQYRWENYSYKEVTPSKFKNNTPTTFEKIAGLCFQLWNFDKTFVKNLYFSIKRRNEFIHPSDSEINILKMEIKKIFEPEGFIILLRQLSDIGKKITNR